MATEIPVENMPEWTLTCLSFHGEPHYQLTTQHGNVTFSKHEIEKILMALMEHFRRSTPKRNRRKPSQ